jgi:hypothetical protein
VKLLSFAGAFAVAGIVGTIAWLTPGESDHQVRSASFGHLRKLTRDQVCVGQPSASRQCFRLEEAEVENGLRLGDRVVVIEIDGETRRVVLDRGPKGE